MQNTGALAGLAQIGLNSAWGTDDRRRKKATKEAGRGRKSSHTSHNLRRLFSFSSYSGQGQDSARLPISVKSKRKSFADEATLPTKTSTKDSKEFLNPLDFVHTPKTSQSDLDTVSSLKTQLKDIIIDLRVYRSKDLESLFTRTRLANRHLAQDKVELAISQALLELNS
jgi:hypothetical protein